VPIALESVIVEIILDIFRNQVENLFGSTTLRLDVLRAGGSATDY
jgi:hypothetical protein